MNGKDWGNCYHIWEEKVDSQFSNSYYIDVTCTECGCPGSLNKETEEVYWPAT